MSFDKAEQPEQAETFKAPTTVASESGWGSVTPADVQATFHGPHSASGTGLPEVHLAGDFEANGGGYPGGGKPWGPRPPIQKPMPQPMPQPRPRPPLRI